MQMSVTQTNGKEDDPMLIEEEFASLVIPIKSKVEDNLFIEIFPEEIRETKVTSLLKALKDEEAGLSVWADSALQYVRHKQHAQDAAQILEAGCKRAETGSKADRVRIFASAAIAKLTAAQEGGGGGGSGGTSYGTRLDLDLRDELTSNAESLFSQCERVDILYPMTWMGKGMLNLFANRLDQARHFFETVLKECGRVLPALLGQAAVFYLERKFKAAQNYYVEAIRLYPSRSGASTRVGFGLACYKLGQVDRAKAAFARALDLDPENVEAMVGAAVLDIMNLDETSNEFNSQMEKAIKMMSMANLLDHTNAMVQNHLANHYFWKWTPIPGTVEVCQGSRFVKGTQPIPLDEGDRVRIGMNFETYVTEDDKTNEEEDDEGMNFQMKESWKGESTSGLKVWKKDYDRVIALAKGAYSSTSVQAIQAESLFFLARVYHVRGMMDDAGKSYEKSCKFNPNLTPARFGLAQVLIYQEQYEEAEAHLLLVLGTSCNATDALATLGLLEVRSERKTDGGLLHLRKAIDLDPSNPELVLLEAMALQQHESNFGKALEKYNKAADLMRQKGIRIPFEIFNNIGVLSHETRKLELSFKCYIQALDAIDEERNKRKVTIDNVGFDGGKIQHNDNNMFFDFIDSGLIIENQVKPDDKEGIYVLKIIQSEEKEASTLVVKVGDDIRLGESFKSTISGIEKNEAGFLTLVTEDAFKGVKQTMISEIEEAEENADKKKSSFKTSHISVSVKRENSLLNDPRAVSIAFNLARLHETAGRTLAAVELHKAILKRNPAYVKSYLRLACIAIDCGALNECAGWLKIAAETAPGNPEVLTLIGNLHLSLCDWAPAQQIFDGLLGKKIPNVEAYALLSMSNIYFANLDIPGRYAKHLRHTGDYCKRILTKDHANAYAANGLGTVIAEKAELFKAKEVFNRVREVTGDTISDTHLNLAHIYLAQKKHPEALQLYRSYLKRTEDRTASITSKSRLDDKVDVLHYIGFAYFDWARQTELFNNVKAAPADNRYKKAMEHIELALIDNTSESKNSLLTYNLCMTKLQAANCVLQKLTRNIRRTAKEVEDAYNGLQHSLKTVQAISKSKNEGAKVLISTSILNDFITHCKSNIESAKSHLEDERKREEEAKEIRDLQLVAAETKREELKLQREIKKQEEAAKQEERDRRAREKMRKVDDLRSGWEQDQAQAEAAKEKRQQNMTPPPPETANAGNLEQDHDEGRSTAVLFDDSDESGEDEDGQVNEEQKKLEKENEEIAKNTTHEDLFGDSSDDESDEEMKPSYAKKRGNEGSINEQSPKKRSKLAISD